MNTLDIAAFVDVEEKKKEAAAKRPVREIRRNMTALVVAAQWEAIVSEIVNLLENPNVQVENEWHESDIDDWAMILKSAYNSLKPLGEEKHKNLNLAGAQQYIKALQEKIEQEEAEQE